MFPRTELEHAVYSNGPIDDNPHTSASGRRLPFRLIMSLFITERIGKETIPRPEEKYKWITGQIGEKIRINQGEEAPSLTSRRPRLSVQVTEDK